MLHLLTVCCFSAQLSFMKCFEFSCQIQCSLGGGPLCHDLEKRNVEIILGLQCHVYQPIRLPLAQEKLQMGCVCECVCVCTCTCMCTWNGSPRAIEAVVQGELEKNKREFWDREKKGERRKQRPLFSFLSLTVSRFGCFRVQNGIHLSWSRKCPQLNISS